jgi:carnitine 3-dehydrogenase
VPERPGAVALLGGGVIGAGWAARFVLNGIDVRLFDPDPDAPRKIGEVLDNARRAYARLTLAPLPAPGQLTYAATAAEAVQGTSFVQESAPERPEIKRELLSAASAAAPPQTVICSSTSGLRPSLLQAGMRHPERFAVGHPFNPVYLLPLVEVCGGEQTAPESLDRAAAVYEAVGMHPLRVRTEIDGFVADRLLEALWREALWLVQDDVATVAEIDDAIRYGAGLRWAFMGTFLTYRIAGGEAGMRHFIEQFGPTLQWPWTKLVDVPELTDSLVAKIAAQSDAQAAGRSTRELEQLRDDCLVAVLHGLRTEGTGAGADLARWERTLFESGNTHVLGNDDDLTQPVRLHSSRVPADWIDYNGHVHESRYLQLFGDASDALLRFLGIDAEYLAEGGSYFTVETHLCHLRALAGGDHVHVTTQVLGWDPKRLHIFHILYRDAEEEPVATAEQLLLHVDTTAGRAAGVRESVRDPLSRLADAHAHLPPPERSGRRIALG